jgi:hypothetical protein
MLPSRYLLGLFAALSLLLTTGCAIKAPQYNASLDNVEQLKKAPASVRLGTFSVQAGIGGPIGLRGNPMASPVGSDYAAYLADALQQELKLAGKLDANSKLEVSGQLLKNDIAAGGIVTNSGEVEARFVVKNDGALRYDEVKRAELNWDSSFLGGVAIPKAQQQYPLIVQKLLAALWGDTNFQAALK